jgi:hypothetical protein
LGRNNSFRPDVGFKEKNGAAMIKRGKKISGNAAQAKPNIPRLTCLTTVVRFSKDMPEVTQRGSPH